MVIPASKIGIDSDKLIEVVNVRFNKGEAPENCRKHLRYLSGLETIFRKMENVTRIITSLLFFSGRFFGGKNIFTHRDFLIAFLITEFFSAQTINH